MAQRLIIARALMHAPQVLFLDEPSTGLDPQARLFVWDRIRELRDRGVTVVLTTHDMDEAAELADRVGIIDHGKLLALDTPAALTRGAARAAPPSTSTSSGPDGDTDDVRRSRRWRRWRRAGRAGRRPRRAARPASYLLRRAPPRLVGAGRRRADRAGGPGSPASASASRAWRTSSST